VISHGVWLHFRFPFSFREVEELMLERGMIISYGAVRRWCLKFGQQYANGLRRRQPQPGGKWHLDEVFIKYACGGTERRQGPPQMYGVHGAHLV
jgi:putative transposase